MIVYSNSDISFFASFLDQNPYKRNQCTRAWTLFAPPTGHVEAAKLLKIKLDNPYLWDIVEPHTPPAIRLGLQSPLKKHLLESTRPTTIRSKKDFFAKVGGRWKL